MWQFMLSMGKVKTNAGSNGELEKSAIGYIFEMFDSAQRAGRRAVLETSARSLNSTFIYSSLTVLSQTVL